jgi:cytochrome c oxidase accessory protein FixG
MEEKSFRDSLGTITSEGKRKWIYPKKPSGTFYQARIIVSLFLLGFFFITPFIKVNGHPFLLFDILNRNFILFGIPFGPHDFHLFVIAMIALIIFVVLFTAIFGRIFCGWACPQTVFMEMVFRRIEYFIEGDAASQKKLNEAQWTGEKFLKKLFKYSIFFVLSFIVANFLLAYIIGMDELLKIISEPPSEHLRGLIAITFFSLFFFWIFSYFREQACIIVCPYGRLQGVLLDQDSVVIAYDHKRGEPRGKLKKGDTSDNGDCIDCELCVDVCPTGIDIRNGVQLECVNCTACIDACNQVMKKIKKPEWLIKYASMNQLEKNSAFRFTPRMIIYSVILVILVSVLSYSLAVRDDFSITVLRTPGMLYQQQPGEKISNLYDLNFINKTFNSFPVTLKLEGIEGEVKIIGNELYLVSQGNIDGKFMVIIPASSISRMNTNIEIGFYSGEKMLRKVNTSFLGPVKEKKE